MQSLIRKNVAWSRRFDALVFPGMTLDGNRDFVARTRAAIVPGLRLVDIGGGKSPMFTAEEVRAMGLDVTGVDIDPDELARAPAGAYREAIEADITTYRGQPLADAVIVQSLLEHVADARGAAQGIASFARPGAAIYTFCPNRRAWFARINRLLPEALKRRLLYAIYPHMREKQGFPARYDRGTPAQLSDCFAGAGVDIVEVRPYYVSSYFMFFFPLYLVWRVVNWPLMKLFPHAFCETFMLVGRKRDTGADRGDAPT